MVEASGHSPARTFGELLDRLGDSNADIPTLHRLLEAVLVVDRLAQVNGVRRNTDLDRGITGLGNTGGGAGVGFAQFGGRIETRRRPELLVELAILGLEAAELHALEQGQAPGGDGKNHQQPDHRAFDGFKWRCQ